MPLFAQLMGSAFRPAEARNLLALADIGTRFALQREAENPYDSNAVAVFLGGHHVGFIEKIVALELAPQIDGGSHFHATLVRKDDPKKPLLRIEADD